MEFSLTVRRSISADMSTANSRIGAYWRALVVVTPSISQAWMPTNSILRPLWGSRARVHDQPVQQEANFAGTVEEVVGTGLGVPADAHRQPVVRRD